MSEPANPRWLHPTRWLGLARGLGHLARRGFLSRRRITHPASDEVRAVLSRHAAIITSRLGEQSGEHFTRLMLDTWQTTMTRRADGSVFVVTGDIPAMWLRDSAAQMRPFVPLAAESDEITKTLTGVVVEQWRSIERDPYANAFNPGPTHASWYAGDLCTNPWVWEQKYEIDSLAFPIQFAWQLWQVTGDADVLEPVRDRARIVVDLWHREQDHQARSSYRFVRPGTGDTLGPDGRGTPVAVTGMTWSGFRPSDDACRYGYNIPAQFFAVHALELLVTMAEHWDDPDLATDCRRLAAEISDGIQQHALTENGTLAYEVDGLGHQLLMDDANMPSLLSLPLCSSLAPDDPLCRRTRDWVLSPENPQFFGGRHATGIGSPHTAPGRIWPIALAVRALTSTDLEEKRALVETLLATTGGTGMMHEAFDPDDPTRFSRGWFSWANAMFCELLLDLTGIRVPRPDPR